MTTLIAVSISFFLGCCFGVLITAVLFSSHNWNDDDHDDRKRHH